MAASQGAALFGKRKTKEQLMWWPYLALLGCPKGHYQARPIMGQYAGILLRLRLLHLARRLYARLLFLKSLSRGVMGCDALRQSRLASSLYIKSLLTPA